MKKIKMTMTLDQTISDNYSKWLSIAKRICGTKAEDVLHTLLLQILEKEDTSYIENWDSYISKSIYVSAYSKTSPYNRIWNRLQVVEWNDDIEYPDIEPQEDIWTAIDDAPFSWWEKEVFKRKVLEEKTFQEIADEAGINIGQAYYSFNKVRNWLKKHINQI